MAIGKKWTLKQVDATKARIRDLFPAAKDRKEARERLAKIQEMLARIPTDGESNLQLDRYVLIMTSLVHHERHGGLKSKDISRAEKTASGILMAHNIPPRGGRLSILYGELHLILSQIYLKSGKQWQAVWQQNLSNIATSTPDPGRAFFQNIATAHRLERVGDLVGALKQIRSIDKSRLHGLPLEKTLLQEGKCLRLAGDPGAARHWFQTNRSAIHSREGQIELDWELACIDLMHGGNPKAMIRLVKTGKPHFSSTYIYEASLWLKALKNAKAHRLFPKMVNLEQRPGLKLRAVPLLYRICVALDDCYDSSIPVHVRARTLGTLAGRAEELGSLDRELLVYAAASRFFARIGQTDLCRTTLFRYQGLSLQATLGKCSNVLGIVGDLLAKDWY